MIQEKIRGWRFLADDRKLKDEDGYVAEIDKTYTTKAPAIEHIEYYDDSETKYNGIEVHSRLIDALHYAQGNVVCYVEATGDVDEDFPFDIIWATEVTVLQMADVERALHHFSFRAMEDILRQNNVTEAYCWSTIRYKWGWLQGKYTDKELSGVWARTRDKYGTTGWASNLEFFLRWTQGWLAARAVAEERHNDWLEEMMMAALDSQELAQAPRPQLEEFRKELLELMRKYGARVGLDQEYGYNDVLEKEWYIFVDGGYVFLEDLWRVDDGLSG